tara:strand:+ start:10940 stop:11158 length:219 start_codon:yes stop_codon:yes gene_type:complete
MKVHVFVIGDEDQNPCVVCAKTLESLLKKLSENYHGRFNTKKDVFDFIKEMNEWGECGWGDAMGWFGEEECD